MANAIAKKILGKVDGEGNRHVLFQEIVDHRYDGTEVKDQDAFITTIIGTECCRETTKGVEVLVQRNDGSTTWVTLKDMQNLYLVHMAEYSVQSCISGNPVFAWWIRHILTKRNRIIGNLRSNYWILTHKFGVKIPKSVQEAKEFMRRMEIPFGWTPYANK